MLRAVLFDMGGTLDGDGLHWLDRFVELYARAGLAFPREMIRAAFDAAERAAATDVPIQSLHLDAMIDRHVGWQLQELRRQGVGAVLDRAGTAVLRGKLVDDFVRPMRAAAVINTRLLESLHAQGLTLGIVSNGCGNVHLLCDDLGYSPWLSDVVDSRRIGLVKPDPAIYAHACQRLQLPPASIMMVGDSFERDIQPARSIGMKTAWLHAGRRCPDPSSVDVLLPALADLAVALKGETRTVA